VVTLVFILFFENKITKTKNQLIQGLINQIFPL